MSTFYNFTEGGKVYSFDDTFVRRDSLAEGELWSWGNNSVGALGDNTTITKSTPVQEFTRSSNWIQVSGVQSTISAIKSDGTLWAWGGNPADNTTANRSTPRQEFTSSSNWKQTSSGADHTLAIKNDGTLWAWGGNSFGQLGDNTTTFRVTPRQISAGATGITGWKQVSAGASSTAAIRIDGTLWCWGKNSYGQVGDNSTSTIVSPGINSRSTPRQISAGATGITGWKQVSAGGYFHTAAIREDGTLWSWGNNFAGAIGDNTLNHRSLPRQEFTASTNWKYVSAGGYGTTIAIKNDGTLWSWGNNSFGQLGDNTTITKSTPVQEFTASTNWKQATATVRYSSYAVKTNGTLWSWGSNTYGQLGDNTNIPKSTPRQISVGAFGVTGWKQVVGAISAAALRYT